MARSPSGTSTSRTGCARLAGVAEQQRAADVDPVGGRRGDLERMLDAADAALGVLRRHLHAIAAGPQPERHRVERRHRVDFLGLAVAPAVAVQHFIGEARAGVAAGERRGADGRGHEHLRLRGSVRHQRRGDAQRHRLQHHRRAERRGERLGRLAEAPRPWLRGELGAVADGHAALAPQRHLDLVALAVALRGLHLEADRVAGRGLPRDPRGDDAEAGARPEQRAAGDAGEVEEPVGADVPILLRVRRHALGHRDHDRRVELDRVEVDRGRRDARAEQPQQPLHLLIEDEAVRDVDDRLAGLDVAQAVEQRVHRRQRRVVAGAHLAHDGPRRRLDADLALPDHRQPVGHRDRAGPRPGPPGRRRCSCVRRPC